MSDKQSSFIDSLREATRGLIFQSESDYPIEPFLLEGTENEPVSPEPVLKAMHLAPNTPVKTQSLGRFFAPSTEEQEWHNKEEREAVQRFKVLVDTLKQNLTGIKVYKVGKIESDVYVVGKTKTSGDLAGVKTKVVET